MENEYKTESFIKMIGIVILICMIFYGLTVLITNNQKEEQLLENEEIKIQYDEILIGSIYNQKENEYYVLAELSSDYLTLNSSIRNYSSKENSLKIYIANLDDGFNKKYLGENSDFTKKYPIFKESTLLKIKDGQIVEYYEGTDAIQKHLS